QVDALAAKRQKIQDNVLAAPATKGKKSKGKKEALQVIGDNRDDQIINLKNALEDLESHVVPKFDEVSQKAVEGNVLVPNVDTEKAKAVELADKLRNEIANKEADKTQAEAVQKNVDALNKALAVVTAEPEAAASSEAAIQNVVDTINPQVNDLKAILEKIDEEPEEALAVLTKEQRDARDKARANANDLLNKLLARLAELQKQLDNLAAWNKRKEEVAAVVEPVNEAIKSLQDEFVTPQPLSTVKDGVRRGEALEPAIKDAEKAVKKAREWIKKHLGDDAEAKTHLDSVQEDLDAAKKARDALINRLQDNAEREDKLVNDQNALIDQINTIGKDAIAVHQSEDIDGKPAALAAIHDQLKPLEEKLAQLEKRAAEPDSAVTHSDSVNLPLVRNRLADIAASLNEQEKDAANKLALADLSSTLDREISALRDDVDKAEHIDVDPAATEEDLRAAADVLAQSAPHIAAVDNLLADVKLQNTPEAAQLAIKTIDDISALSERLTAAQQGLRDRADTLADFNKTLNDIGADLESVTNTSAAIAVKPSDANVADVDAVKERANAVVNALTDVTPDLEALQPLKQPASRHAALLDAAKATIDDLDKTREAVATAAIERDASNAFADRLTAAENALDNAEKAVAATPVSSVEALQNVDRDQISPLAELVSTIDETPVPTVGADDAKKRKKTLKKRLAALKDKHNKDLAHAKEQNDLLNKLEGELAELEGLTSNITSTSKGPAKDLNVAVEDRDALNKIIERVGP
ncbi:hypothetical protein NEOKW01_2153, partial [Nematocida sp. AWRm80]